MHADVAGILIGLLLATGFFAGAIYVLRSDSVRMVELTASLAADYGLELDRSNQYKSTIYPAARGRWRNRFLVVDNISVVRGRRRVPMTRVLVQIDHASPCTLEISPYRYGNRIWLAGRSLKTHAQAFDARFFVRTTDPGRALAWLDLETRTKLIEALALGARGDYTVAAGGVKYQQFGAILRERNLRCLSAVISAAYLLAARVD